MMYLYDWQRKMLMDMLRYSYPNEKFKSGISKWCPDNYEENLVMKKYMDISESEKVFNSFTHLSKGMLTPIRIIHSGPCTIVFWPDKTKTVVRLSDNDLYDEYQAFCAALAIKIFGSNSALKKMLERTPTKFNDPDW